MWPIACAGQVGDFLAGGAEFAQLIFAQAGGNDNEAIAFDGFLEMGSGVRHDNWQRVECRLPVMEGDS